MIARVLWGIVLVLLVFWLIGQVFSLLGWLIHVALVIAVVVVIYNLVFARRQSH